MAAFATVEDYEDRADVVLSDRKRVQVEAYLDDASALMRRHIPAGYTPDTDADGAFTVGMVDQGLPGWRDDPYGCWPKGRWL